MRLESFASMREEGAFLFGSGSVLSCDRGERDLRAGESSLSSLPPLPACFLVVHPSSPPITDGCWR